MKADLLPARYINRYLTNNHGIKLPQSGIALPPDVDLYYYINLIYYDLSNSSVEKIQPEFQIRVPYIISHSFFNSWIFKNKALLQ